MDLGSILDDLVDLLVVFKDIPGVLEVLNFLLRHTLGERVPVLLD